MAAATGPGRECSQTPTKSALLKEPTAAVPHAVEGLLAGRDGRPAGTCLQHRPLRMTAAWCLLVN